MHVKELLYALPFYTTNQPIKNIRINGLNIDHREIKQGNVFICIKGFTVDGHDFAHLAVQNGASLIVAEKQLKNITVPVIIVSDTTRSLALLAARFYQYPTHQFPLIGVTGTNGKTTTTYLLEEIFR